MSALDPVSFVNNLESIGSVPTAVSQLFSLINDPKASMHDFERVVRPDVGLTANLLKCANSAYYRGSREITSVKDAIARMGLRRVFEVVAGASFAQKIPDRLKGYGLPASSYWSHSIAVGVLADRVGREAGFTYPDMAFTAGLLHDLGKVAIATFLSQPGVGSGLGVLDGALRNLGDENKLVGTTHAVLGEALGLKWKLPKDICAAARWHHEPAQAPTATLRYLATVVQVADAAAGRVDEESREGTDEEPIDAQALERLSLDPVRLAQLVEESRAEIARTRELFRGVAKAA